MNVDEILRAVNDEQVDYLLIGGMNFLLRHQPVLTFDVDLWIRDDSENLQRLNRALGHLGAEWGRTEQDWKPIPHDWRWLQAQDVFCLTTHHGALDLFREVLGLEGQYPQCKARSLLTQTTSGIAFQALSDPDMLVCQDVLPPNEQKAHRIQILKVAIRKAATGNQ